MADLAAPPPSSCPGTGTEESGKADACNGCPNQAICAAAGPATEDPDVEVIARNLSNVTNIIMVLSGKGGVGKSTVTANIARCLALDSSINVGVLDVDLCGPSQPRLLGAEGEGVHSSASGWSPVYVEENISLMSAGFLLPSPDAALIWRGPKKNGLIKQLLRDVDWGDLDFLLIDTPPGTSDEHLSLVQFLAKCKGLRGAVVVTTPQEVSVQDVRREVTFCNKVSLPILGLVENMALFTCPHCSHTSTILPPGEGGVNSLGLGPALASLPLDPLVGKNCDEGTSLWEEHGESRVAKAYQELVTKLREKLETS